MKFGCPLYDVKDMAVSRAFYETVMGQTVVLDLDVNVAFGTEGGPIFALQQGFAGLVGVDDFPVRYHNNDHEMVFEEEDFDAFCQRLKQQEGIRYIHDAKEYPWGQRVVRFYDPDFHVIEVGETMESVFKRFHGQGMSIEEVAERTGHPVEYVKQYLSERALTFFSRKESNKENL